MSGMTWQALPVDTGSSCEVVLGEGLPASELTTCFMADTKTWSWRVELNASEHTQHAYGYGCATEGKARFMAMSLVSALLQIIDGVKPHEVD